MKKIVCLLLVLIYLPVVSIVGQDSQKAKKYYDKAYELFQADNYLPALKYLDMALALNENYLVALEKRVEINQMLHRYDDAITDLTKIIALKKNDNEKLLERGKMYFAQYMDRYNSYVLKNAINDFETVISNEPEKYEAYILLSYAYLKDDRPLQAKEGFDTAINVFLKSYGSNLAAKYLEEGERNLKYGDFKQSVKNLTESIRFDSANSQAYFLLALSKRSMKDYQGSIEYFTMAINHKWNYYEAYYERGKTKYQDKHYQGAIMDFSKAIAKNPKFYYDAYIQRGLSYQRLNKTEEALHDFTLAIDTSPKEPRAYYCKADLYNENNNDTAAIKFVNLYLENCHSDQETAKGMLLRSQITFAAGRYDESIKEAQTIDENDLDRNSRIERVHLMAASYYRLKKYAEAKKYFLFLVNSGNSGYSNDLAWLYIEDGDYSSAVNLFADVIKADTSSFTPYFGLSLGYYMGDELELAKKYFSQACAREPSLLNGLKGLEVLQKKGFYFTEKTKSILVTLTDKPK